MNRSSVSGRLPRTRRAVESDRPPFRLTQRDLDVIDAVWRYRALTTPQLVALLFGGGRQTLRVCQRRLQRLFHHGLLARVEQPSLISDGSKPFLYLLDKIGARLLSKQRGVGEDELDWQPWSNAVGAPYLDHLLSTNDIRIAVALASAREGWTIPVWYDDKSLRSYQMKDYVTIRDDREGDRRAAVVPDGYFKLQTSDDTYNFFLEIDKRTVTAESSVSSRRDWSRKIKVYLAYYRSGGYERRYGTTDMRLLTVTTGDKRLSNLMEITGRIAGNQESRFWFTTFERVTSSSVLTESIWNIAGRSGYHAIVV